MASPIMTGGFQVNAQPGINYLDPRLITPAYGDIIPSASRGAALGQQFINIRDDATMRPIRQQLAGLSLQEAQNRLAMAPLEQQLAALRLGEAQKRSMVPEFITEGVDIVGGDRRLTPVDPNATFENFQITEEFAPRERVTRGREVLAGGEVRPTTRRETLASAAQVASESAKEAAALESARALAAQRNRPRQFESTALAELYQNAVAEGDTEAASLYKARLDRLNRAPGFLPEGTAYQRRIETMAADAGLTLAAANELAQTPQGAEALAQLAVRNKAVARDPLNASFAPQLTPAQQAIVSRAGQGGQVDGVYAASPGGGKRSTPATFSYTTVEEAESAIGSGTHIPGDKITVGTQTFTVQE